jgi:hypothetical protein
MDLGSKELRVDDFGPLGRESLEGLQDAIDNASDQDVITYIIGLQGTRIAAIVPVEVAEKYEADLSAVVAALSPNHRA